MGTNAGSARGADAVLALLSIGLPIIQAPMAGADSPELAVAVSRAGGLGSLACAMLSAAQIREQVAIIRQQTERSFNLNFFCHQTPEQDAAREAQWLQALQPYYATYGFQAAAAHGAPSRAPFNAELCALTEELRPAVVSFHFGLPEPAAVARLKSLGSKILGCATSVAEAVWLEQHGSDAVIAQGSEAGGHRGMFIETDIATQMGTFALVPQVVDAVRIPVIAAGGISDSRGIKAALALGASAVQLGTAYLFCPEARISAVHRQALRSAKEHPTALTNLFSGRPARGFVNRLMREMGPMSTLAPAFPLAGPGIAPLRRESERRGSLDFAQMWSGQAASLGLDLPACTLTKHLATQAGLTLDPVTPKGTVCGDSNNS